MWVAWIRRKIVECCVTFLGCNLAGGHHMIALMHPVVWLGTESPSLNCGQAVRSSGEEYFLKKLVLEQYWILEALTEFEHEEKPL